MVLLRVGYNAVLLLLLLLLLQAGYNAFLLLLLLLQDVIQKLRQTDE
jgi:hypothetical protein